MKTITFRVRLFTDREDPRDRQRSHLSLLVLMEALTRVNELYLAQHPETPPLYKAGVRYKREGVSADGRPAEEWQDIPTLYATGAGDCEDLSCALAAELRHKARRRGLRGFRARPYAQWRREPGKPFRYHGLVLVEYKGKRRLLDPSRKLGMGWEALYAKTHPKGAGA